MKNKGFTLIELLAVIVILAIIALIAIPIILNIINDSKESSNQRSIELYGHAVENAVARYQLKEGKPATNVSDLTIEYNGSRVECETTVINSDGTVYLSNCEVNGTLVEGYTYGKEENKSTTVYRWSTDSISIGDTIDPSNTIFTTDPTTLGENYYLKHVVDKDNKVTESYVCTVYNSKEACERGGNADYYGYVENESEYTGNLLILKGLQDEGISCDFHGVNSYCDDGSVHLDADSDGNVYADDDSGYCGVDSGGSSYCGSS